MNPLRPFTALLSLLAFAALPAEQAQVLEHELVELLNEMNTAGTGSLVVPSAYLEVVIKRR